MDIRIENIFAEEMQGDTSFLDKGSGLSRLFGRSSYSDMDMRETWHKGIKHGIEIGLRRSSPQGQIIELNHNTPEGKNKEFLKKFYKLAEEYKCEIEYHPQKGMIVIDRDYSACA